MNELGQRTAVQSSGSAFTAARAVDWGYNPRGEVTRAAHTDAAQSRFYEYDPIGNRKKSRNGTPTDSGGQLVNYTANALNQYTAIAPAGSAAVSPTHDPDGNQLSGSLRADPAQAAGYLWDGENRLIEAKSNGTTVGQYQYDPFGRRIAKTTGGITTHFIYEGWNPIAEHSRSVGVPPTLSRTHLWGQDLSGSEQGAGGVGGLLSTSNHQLSTQKNYPLYDGNGNVTQYLDASGTTVAHYEYDPFGKLTVNTDTENQFPIRFSTKYEDSETGMDYYGYRYYDPQHGRWLGRDPIGENGGVNIYGMLRNNAILFVDKLGLGTVIIDSSCKGHEDLLGGMTYFSEEEPPSNGPKVHRSLPKPGDAVDSDALYNGNGTATKIPDGGQIKISCYCENGKWMTRQSRVRLRIPFTDRDEFTEWPKNSPITPNRWPGTGQENIVPHDGTPPDGPPLPPLNPRTISG